MLKDERGGSIILVAMSLTILLGMLALVADLGMGFAKKTKLQHTADAAALAGAQELPSTEKATEAALDYAVKNGIQPSQVQVTISTDGTSITVEIHETIFYTFARVLGHYQQTAGVKAKALNAPVTGMKGVRPLTVEDFPFVVGEQYVLKEGAGDGYNGNFGPVALGGGGASTYEYNLVNGYGSLLKIGDRISTETGNMSNVTRRAIDDLIAACNHSPPCTYYNYERDCPRIIHIPIVDNLDLNGHKEATVVGFAAFFLEGAQNSGGHLEVVGRFIKTLASGEISPSQKEYGLNGVKLVR